ncbi:hypothetical protein [Microbacterium aerolatum]|uniref:hypothetical protein n=1 Tax=Microbacterium aerolatum TaxID=153731 RepID=UPI00384C0359
MSAAVKTATDVSSGDAELSVSGSGFLYRYSDAGHSMHDVADETGDCGVRAVTIATGRDYDVVRAEFTGLLEARRGRKAKNPESVTTGLKRPTVGTILGSEWAYKSHYGSSPMPRFVHSTLPAGQTFVVVLGRHYCPVINGVIHDLFDPSGPDAIIYGYFHRVDAR